MSPISEKCWYISSVKIVLYDVPETCYFINEIVLKHPDKPNMEVSFSYVQHENPVYHKRIEILYENDIVVHSQESTIHYRELLCPTKDEFEFHNSSADRDEFINIWLFERKLPLLLKSAPITFYDNYRLLQTFPDKTTTRHSAIGPDYTYDRFDLFRKNDIYENALYHIREILPIEMGPNTTKLQKLQYNKFTHKLYLNSQKWVISRIQYVDFFNYHSPSYIIIGFEITNPLVPSIRINFRYKKTHLSYQCLVIQILKDDKIIDDFHLLINFCNILNYQRVIKTDRFEYANGWLFKQNLPVVLNSMSFDNDEDLEKVIITRKVQQNDGYNYTGARFHYKKVAGIENRRIYKNTIYHLKTLLPTFMGKNADNLYYAHMFEFVMRKNPFFCNSTQNIDNIIRFVNPFITVKPKPSAT